VKTQLQLINIIITQNTEDGAHITRKKSITRTKYNDKEKIGKCGPCPVFASYSLAFSLQMKKHGKPSVRVVEKCPDIPVAVVPYTKAIVQYTYN
jgi:hypothetical protein